jgi:putative FmdB family regulatory protein
MPLYEYECEKCHHRFERIQKFSDPPIAECPVCGGPVHKLISSPAIQFKGSGWYITDYARKDSVSSEKSEKSEKSEGSSGEKPVKESTDASTDGKKPKESKESKDSGKSAGQSDKGATTSGSSTSAPDS